jgi:hypothetical protein
MPQSGRDAARRGRTAQQAGVAVQDVLALAALQHGGRLGQLLRGLHRVVRHQVLPVADLRACGRHLSAVGRPQSALAAEAALLRLTAAPRVSPRLQPRCAGRHCHCRFPTRPCSPGTAEQQPLTLLSVRGSALPGARPPARRPVAISLELATPVLRDKQVDAQASAETPQALRAWAAGLPRWHQCLKADARGPRPDRAHRRLQHHAQQLGSGAVVRVPLRIAHRALAPAR